MMKRWRLLGVALIALLAIGLYRAKTEAEAARARVEAQERAAAALRAEIDALEAEAQSLAAPGRIEDLAARELGMAPAAPGRTITPDALDRIAPVADEPAP